MKLPLLGSLVAVCFSSVISAQSHAQPVFGSAESIECTVANARIVVVGKILSLGGDGLSEQGEWCEATIAVEETLKGEHGRQLRVRFFNLATELAKWKDRRLLVAVNGEPPTVTTLIDLADEKLEVFAAELAVLRKPEDVIRMARETARRMPGVMRIECFEVELRPEAFAGTKWKGCSGLRVSVPIGEPLERRARESIRSLSFQERWEGVRALRYFKSDANIARARSLLDDPGWAYLHLAEENEGLEVRTYNVREEAYQTLKSWGIDVKMPVIREETWKLESVTTVDLSHTKVTVARLKELARFENLQNLFLWDVPVTDASLREIGGLKNLQALYLGGTGATDEGLKHLAGLMSLRYLDLRGTKVADEGLKVLAGFKSLKKVDLGQTRVTDRGLAELRKLRPEMEIER